MTKVKLKSMELKIDWKNPEGSRGYKDLMFLIFMDLEVCKMTEVRVVYSTLKYCRGEGMRIWKLHVDRWLTLVEEKGIVLL